MPPPTRAKRKSTAAIHSRYAPYKKPSSEPFSEPDASQSMEPDASQSMEPDASQSMESVSTEPGPSTETGIVKKEINIII